MRAQQQTRIVLILALFFVWSCSARRVDPQPQVATGTGGVVQDPSNSQPAPVQEDAGSSAPLDGTSPGDEPLTAKSMPEGAKQEALPETDPVEDLMTEAVDHFLQGERRFLVGEPENGRAMMAEALERLKNSGYHFSEYRELEALYYDLLADLQTLEIKALSDPASLPLPQETSPLDEILDLNLYSIEADPALEALVTEELRNTRFDIPVVLNSEVLKFLDYYQNRGRKIMEKGIRNSGRYRQLFEAVFEEEGVPKDLIYMAHVESLFNPRAYSRARALGIWQFMTSTARLYGLEVNWWLDERSDVAKSTRAAARHLRDLYTEFEDWELVLAAYNAGPGWIRKNIKRHGKMDYWTMIRRRLLPRETRNHVPSILAAIIIYKNPERYGFSIAPEPELLFETVPVGFQADLSVIAEAVGIDSTYLSELNPELRRNITPPPEHNYSLRVPLGMATLIQEQLEEIPPDKRLRMTFHKVRQGETLSVIARHYGISIQAIGEANRLRNLNRLSIGQELMIPLSDSKAFRTAQASTPTRVSVEDRPSYHVVRRGESLYRIARRYGLSLTQLTRMNDLKSSRIYPGQRLRIQADGADAAGRVGRD